MTLAIFLLLNIQLIGTRCRQDVCVGLRSLEMYENGGVQEVGDIWPNDGEWPEDGLWCLPIVCRTGSRYRSGDTISDKVETYCLAAMLSSDDEEKIHRRIGLVTKCDAEWFDFQRPKVRVILQRKNANAI